MPRGNCFTKGDYEGLYYIDNDLYHVFSLKPEYREEHDEYNEYWDKLIKDIDYNDFYKYELDEDLTTANYEGIKDYLQYRFTEKFKSFEYSEGWDKNTGNLIILENELFYIELEDNDWSIAVELIQKDDFYRYDDKKLNGLRKKHYKSYLKGIKEILLEYLPYLYEYNGPWTSKQIFE